MSERRDWIVYPWQIDAVVARWQANHPDLISVRSVRQYTNHRVYAITVTAGGSHTIRKRCQLAMVPHAHEPAGTAGCMNFINQLLTGHHLDGTASTLVRERILEETVLTFIPDGNPYGRARAPEPCWDGSRYSNREFINMVFGLTDLAPTKTSKSPWAEFRRVDSFEVGRDPPGRIGLAYEQVDDSTFVEPFRFDPRASIVKLLDHLLDDGSPDQVLNLHQTEFEDTPAFNCKAVLPGIQEQLHEDLQRFNRAWAETLHSIWRSLGGRPRDDLQIGFASLDHGPSLHRQIRHNELLDRLQRLHPFLTLEILNNNPSTTADDQLLLVDAALWGSVELLVTGDHPPNPYPKTPS